MVIATLQLNIAERAQKAFGFLGLMRPAGLKPGKFTAEVMEMSLETLYLVVIAALLLIVVLKFVAKLASSPIGAIFALIVCAVLILFVGGYIKF